MTEFYGEIYRLNIDVESQAVFQDLAFLLKRIHDWHEQMHHEIYRDIHAEELADNEISSLLNVNRELLNSSTALVMALREFNLEEGEVAVLDQLPGPT